jgi:hypothetical protein
VEHGKRYGRIFFKYYRSPQQLLKLRSVEGIFAVLAEIHRVTAGRPGLDYLCGKIRRLEMRPAIRLAQVFGASLNAEKFQLNVTLQGAHRFTRAELARSIQKLLVQHHGLRPGNGKDSMQFHLQVAGRRALFSLRVPAGRPRYTSVEREGLGGSLAYCLALILDIQEEDIVVVLDCGKDGLDQLQQVNDPHLLIALILDIQEEDIVVVLDCGKDGLDQLQQVNDPHLLIACHHDRARLVTAKAFERNQVWLAGSMDELPLAAKSVDCLLGMVPTSKDRGFKEECYRQMEESARILRPGGVGALLVADPRGFLTVLQTADWPFAIMAGLPISLKARKYAIFLLERLEEDESGLDLLHIERAPGV